MILSGLLDGVLRYFTLVLCMQGHINAPFRNSRYSNFYMALDLILFVSTVDLLCTFGTSRLCLKIFHPPVSPYDTHLKLNLISYFP